MLRCIHVSPLCVQQLPEDRPNMSFVVMMLGSESLLPEPKEPSFLIGKIHLMWIPHQANINRLQQMKYLLHN